jgi:hypothetical protein
MIGPQSAHAFGQGFTRAMFHCENDVAHQSIVKAETKCRLKCQRVIAAADAAVRDILMLPNGAGTSGTDEVRVAGEGVSAFRTKIGAWQIDELVAPSADRRIQKFSKSAKNRTHESMRS